MKKHVVIANKNLPVAKLILDKINSLSDESKLALIGDMTIDEFVDHRVDVFLSELETALQAGLDPAGAEEIAYKESLSVIYDRREVFKEEILSNQHSSAS